MSGKRVSGGKGDLWRWPEVPRHSETTELLDGTEGALKEYGTVSKLLKSPYYEPKPPMCYPGTPLLEAQMECINHIIVAQLNAIGTHTRGKQGETGFGDLHDVESRAIWMMASVMGGTPDTVDGYFCGGATEANDQSLWIGREWLRLRSDPMNRGVAVLCTPLTHYSIDKACDKMDLGKSRWSRCPRCRRDHLLITDPRGSGTTLVGMNHKGEMDVDDLERVFRLRYEEGFRRFLVVANVGTTVMGSIDPVEAIGARIDKLQHDTCANIYLHVDAAFAGFTVPFVNKDLKFGFNVEQVMSVSIDGDKMGRLPYPGGIFLCRKDLQSLVARQVAYIGGNEDDTFCGSRTSVAPILAWLQFQTFGMEGQREYVQKCLDVRQTLITSINERLQSRAHFRMLPYSPWVNQLPIEMNLDARTGRIPEVADYPDNPLVKKIQAILEPYHLRHDFFPSDPMRPTSCPRLIYKLCIMPHHTPQHMLTFVDDLVAIDRLWAEQTGR